MTVTDLASIARYVLLALVCAPAADLSAFPLPQAAQKDQKETAFVRVQIIARTRGAEEVIEINGRRVPNYRPTVIHVFPATGVVMDDAGHVLTFLGYRWVDIPASDARIEIISGRGQKHAGKLVGIDQSTGVAVIRPEGVKLERTPICEKCEMNEGTTVVTMVAEEKDGPRYHRAQVVSVGGGAEAPGRGGWVMRINRPLSGVGEPLLNTEHQVLGFIASQRPSEQNARDVNTVVYPMSQLLNSARRILRAGGDIQTGWLGVFVTEVRPDSGHGVVINGVEENSPAARAGLLPRDVLLRWDGEEIRGTRQFIRFVQNTEIGSRVEMEVLRDSVSLKLSAQIAARRQREAAGRMVLDVPAMVALKTPGLLPQWGSGPRALAGIDLATLTPQLAEFLEVGGYTGLLVLQVDRQSSFAAADIRAGDIILAVDGRPITDPEGFSTRIQDRGWGGQLLLSILRKGAEHLVTVELPAAPTIPRKP